MPGIMLARPTFSWPGLVIGLLIGTIYCITNIYLGLKTGQISGAPIATAFFTTLLSNQLKLRLNGEQIMFTITVSTAVAIMSLAGGFVGPIPALTQLLGPEERVEGPISLSWLQLTTFAATLSLPGPMFAMLMRGHFLGSGRLDELPFPTATATAKVIRAYSDGMRDEDKDPALGSRVAADDRRSDQPTSESIAEDRNRCAICGISLSLIYVSIVLPSLRLFRSIRTDDSHVCIGRVNLAIPIRSQRTLAHQIRSQVLELGRLLPWCYWTRLHYRPSNRLRDVLGCNLRLDHPTLASAHHKLYHW